MKNLVILALLVVATIGQGFSQTMKEKINLTESQIKEISSDLKRSEKNFKSGKAKQLAELKRDYRKWQIAGSRSDDKTEIANALKATTRLQSQIDSINALTSNEEIDAQRDFLKSWQDKKAELIAQFMEVKSSKKTALANSTDITKLVALKPAKELKEKADIYDRRIPTEVTNLHYGRRTRSQELQVNDLVLVTVANNMNHAIIPTVSEGGLRVIFDNMYVEPVSFIVRAVNGIARKPIVVDQGKREAHNLLPGKYTVELYINGHISGAPRLLTIDGQTASYKGELCFGFVYAPRF